MLAMLLLLRSVFSAVAGSVNMNGTQTETNALCVSVRGDGNRGLCCVVVLLPAVLPTIEFEMWANMFWGVLGESCYGRNIYVYVLLFLLRHGD